MRLFSRAARSVSFSFSALTRPSLLRAGAGAVLFGAAAAHSDAGSDDSRLQAEPESLVDGPQRAPNPGDFGNREHELALNVDPAEGLSLVLQSSVGAGRGESGAVMLQMQFAPAGAQSYLVVTDSREPSLQLVFAPGHEGRTAKVVVGVKPLAGVTLEGEVLATAAGALAHAKGTAKVAIDDAWLTAAYTVPFGSGAPAHAELAYHQAVTARSTAGGSLTAVMGASRVSAFPQWSVFGSALSAHGDSQLLGKFAIGPRHDGQSSRTLSMTAWHRATPNLELSTTLAVSLGTPEGMPTGTIRPVDSSCGIGARMSFEGGGGLNPVLGVNVNGRTAGVSYTVPFAGFGSNTFLRTTASVVADHAAKDYKVGANVEMYY